MIKTFRGKLADGGQDTIRLSTNNGMIGYRIKKFQAMGISENETYESAIQLFTFKQATPSAEVHFDNSELLAAILYADSTGSDDFAKQTIIFDHVTINQDIFVTFASIASSPAMNYYLELEQVKLDLGEATVATLKDMRGTN